MKSKSAIIAIIAIIVLSLLILSIGYYIERKYSSNEQNYIDNYPLLKKDSSYKGVIIKEHYTHGRNFFRLKNDSTKHSVIFNYNYDFEPYYVGNFLMTGDSIIKNANSDSLIIFRNTERYSFTILQK